MLTLRPYQQKAVDSVFAWFEGDGHNAHPLIVLPTGTGKSLVLSEICRRSIAEYGDMKIVVVTHVMELIKQNHDEMLTLWPKAPVGIYSAGIGQRKHQAAITFCGIQSVHKKAHLFQKVDFVMVDECFTKETVISTPHGPKTIDLVRCGDSVYNAGGVGVVERVSARPAEETYTLEFDDGTRTTCTGNHKFFTERGWAKASSLAIGSHTFSIKAVRLLWERVQAVDKKGCGGKVNFHHSRVGLEQGKILLNILFKEIRKPNERLSDSFKNEGNIKENKTSSYSSWRERAITTLSTACASTRAGRGVGGRSGGGDEDGAWRWLSDLLQNRHSPQRKKNGDRIRLGKPREYGEKGAGHKENRVSYFPRLVNISRVKHESPRTVFNLQVSGHPSYFANGKLVHNCHLLGRADTSMYQRFLKGIYTANPHMKVIGLTATPYRMDTGMLHTGEGALFDDICFEYSVLDAIKEGYLCNLITKQTKLGLDTAGVHTRGGEFIASELQNAVDLDEINEAAVEEIIQWSEGRKSWLIFGSGVEHSQHLCERLVGKGVVAKCIFGDTPKDERAQIIAAFKRGEITALCSMGVLTTGFNAPNVDMIAVLRPTQSPGLYVQIVGRGMRNSPGKADCLILDFARNIERHGPVDMVRGRDKKKMENAGGNMTKVCPECKSVMHISIMTCPDCGYEFPKPIKLVAKADVLPVLSTGAVAHWIDVDDVSYSVHKKPDKPDSLKVTYWCGFLKYQEWVCFNHQGYAQQKAMGWWVKRAGNKPPTNVEEAIARKSELKWPKQIQVIRKGKFDEIVAYNFAVLHMPQGAEGVPLRSESQRA